MKQLEALEILKTGCNVYLTGQAGAGKTHLLNAYIRYLHDYKIPVAITASTGIAATHMDGMTIHGWSGIGIKDAFEPEDFKKLLKREHVVERLKKARVLIIDEISMLHAKQVDLVDEILRVVRASTEPFGGLQVIFSGDFFQLPPVGKKEETTRDKFAFMSQVWIQMATAKPPQIKVCYLSEQHRQTDEDEKKQFGLSLNEILNQIRNQQIDAEVWEILSNSHQKSILENRTRLYTHNVDVDKINQKELDKLPTESHEFVALTFGEQLLVDGLKKNVRAPENLSLKVGARVMFVKNNALLEVYNGTMGEVVKFVDSSLDNAVYPVVRLNDGTEHMVTPETWSIDDEDQEVLASYTQLPLCLAWAITVHKSQGMTLEAAEIDLSKTFEMGQGYVALSRLKSLKGLKLLGINHKALLLDEFAYRANQRFLELSAESKQWLDSLAQDELEKLQKEFVFCNRGEHEHSSSQKTSEEYLALVNKAQKKSMMKQGGEGHYDAVLPLIKDKKSIDEMKKSLSISIGSLIESIEGLLKTKQITHQDIDHLKPDESVIKEVLSFVTKVTFSPNSNIGKKTVKLKQETSIELKDADIRVALLFLD